MENLLYHITINAHDGLGMVAYSKNVRAIARKFFIERKAEQKTQVYL